MKVEFHDHNRPGIDSKLFEREISILPSKGDEIANHTDTLNAFGNPISNRYEVVGVTHVYEDRESYRGKSYGGDRVCVTLKQHVP